MVFSSILFIFFFLPAVLLVYFIVPLKLRHFVLLFFSLLFYAWGEPIYIFIMLFSTIFDYVNGLLIERFYSKDNHNAAKTVMVCSVIVNLGILAFLNITTFLLKM